MANVGFRKGYECEDCGKGLTYRDFYLYVWVGGAPVGEVPRCCEGCADRDGGRSEMASELDSGFDPRFEMP